MGFRCLIASRSAFILDVEAVLQAAGAAFPGAEIYRPSGPLAETLAAELYLPGPAGASTLDVSFHRGGEGLSIGGGSNPEQLAEFVAWLARTAPVPEDGSVVLIEWAPEFVPLRPDVTAEQLLVERLRGS